MHVFSLDHRVVDTSTIAGLGLRVGDLYSRLDADPTVRGAVVLSTCARIEAYVDASSFHGPQRAFIEFVGSDPARVTSHRGRDGLEHLFRVASGLESAVVGEAQVSGQVRDAILSARSRGQSTRTLDVAFENALRVSRKARALLANQPSMADVALDSLDDSRPPYGTTLVVGTGAFAEECIASLRARGSHTVLVHSPSDRRDVPDGADHLVAADELASAVALSDVTVTASGHGPDVITRQVAASALSQRSSPLLLVDLAGSGDVASELDADPDIRVVRISDLAQDDDGTDAASTLVRGEARVLYPRIEGGELDNLIVRLRQHVHDVARAELGATADPAAVEAIRRVTQALLHDPTVRAREAAANGELERYRAALETVFGLAHAAADAEGSAA